MTLQVWKDRHPLEDELDQYKLYFNETRKELAEVRKHNSELRAIVFRLSQENRQLLGELGTGGFNFLK